MNNLDVAGILRTYAEKAANAYNTQKLREVVSELKSELDLRKINMEDKRNNETHIKECYERANCH